MRYSSGMKAAASMLNLGDGEVCPRDRGPAGKLTLLLESTVLISEDLGEWLRSRGLHAEHLPLWGWRFSSWHEKISGYIPTTIPRRFRFSSYLIQCA